MSIMLRGLVAAAGLALLATQSFAAAVVNVAESGEGGGAMAIKLDKAEVPSGEVTFKVVNEAVTEDHEMIIVKLKTPDQMLAVVKGKGRIDEKHIKTIDEVEVKAAAKGEVSANLGEGDYMLICNIKGHFEAGMWTKFKVVKQSASN